MLPRVNWSPRRHILGERSVIVPTAIRKINQFKAMLGLLLARSGRRRTAQISRTGRGVAASAVVITWSISSA